MSVFSANEVCCLFCCPPWPSKIVAKLAFVPPRPTYNFQTTTSSDSYYMVPNDDSDYNICCDVDEQKIDCFYTRTKKHNLIACMYIRCAPKAKYTILYSHGNAVDLGQMCNFYVGLGTRVNCNIFSYDYSGYGASTGKPSEKNLYADVEAALHALKIRYGIRPESVILYGQSIGTAPTVDLAAKYDVGGVVLHSPLMSGVRVAFPNTRRTWFFDAFTNIEKISKVTSPVLIIHGTDDEIIDFNHGLLLYEKCRRPVEPLWVEGAGHNDIEQHNVYLERLNTFLKKDLAHPNHVNRNKK